MSKEKLVFNESTYVYHCGECGAQIIAKEVYDAMLRGEITPYGNVTHLEGKRLAMYCEACGNQVW